MEMRNNEQSLVSVTNTTSMSMSSIGSTHLRNMPIPSPPSLSSSSEDDSDDMSEEDDNTVSSNKNSGPKQIYII